ncbi:glycosyltransferase [Bacillus clarus]|uniref:Glycosyl transferase 2 family protein n=1 Tax=Bacillus clarus TaxID=2338372 RepID=A0A090YSG4_9BACI|nr:glycosyltransferase [Bacillus clarus]KFN01172.1 glycosyl transferase 2 family protein [Bacillus clarus]RFT67165.1 glycosyltransferase [Bacillus clarus]
MRDRIEKDEENTNLLPLVSVLIPTYNRPLYFEQSLCSVLEQTYPNIEVIIGDDSTNNETEKILQKYLSNYPNITYIKNNSTLGQFENAIMLFNKASGEYVNYLMDDDLFHINKIEKMMQYYINDTTNDIKLITSHRQVIDTDGNLLPDVYSTMRLFEQDTIMDGVHLGNIVIMNQRNYIGEPTTVLFRKKDLDDSFGIFDNRKYLCNVDVASWLSLLAKGKAVYIAETLSYFRLHPNQQLNESNKLIDGLEDFSHGIIEGEKYGFLSLEEELDTAIINFLAYAKRIVPSPAVYSLEYYQKIMIKKLYMEKKKQFINIHSNLPKVSILIPAYNRPHYLEIALRSALNQTYENIEIIICDDSTNNEVKSMLQPYLEVYECITYVKNDVPLVAENFNKCIELSKGDYLNFLLDDDVFHHEKIERMMPYFFGINDLAFVTSYRELIDENGELLPPSTLNLKIATETTVFEGKNLGNYMLKNLKNVVGEPTTVLYSRKFFYGEFGCFKGKAYSAINDIATWLDMLKKGKAVYIEEPLSYFRQHSGQNQKQMNFILMTIEEWIELIVDARESGFLNSEQEYKESLSYCLENAGYILKDAVRRGELSLIKNENIKKKLNKLVTHIFSDYFCSCPYCNRTFDNFSPWPAHYDFPKYKFEMWNKDTGICPICNSMDRERLYRTYIETETNLLSENHKILHIAPEARLREWLNQFTNLSYVCGDLIPKDQLMEEVDVTNIVYENEAFDVIICSHVLEHVPEDEKAMKELYRVLKPGGWGIIQVPIVMHINSIIEGPSIVTPQMRKLVFGQEDHVRIYNQAGFIQRLKNAGFYVELYNIAEKYGIEQARKLGLSETDMLYIVRK